MLEATTPGQVSGGNDPRCCRGHPRQSVGLDQALRRADPGAKCRANTLSPSPCTEIEATSLILPHRFRGFHHVRDRHWISFLFLTGAAPIFWKKYPGTCGRVWMKSCFRRDCCPHRFVPQNSESNAARSYILGYATGGKNSASPRLGIGCRNCGSPGVAVASELHAGHAPRHVVQPAPPCRGAGAGGSQTQSAVDVARAGPRHQSLGRRRRLPGWARSRRCCSAGANSSTRNATWTGRNGSRRTGPLRCDSPGSSSDGADEGQFREAEHDDPANQGIRPP